MEIWFEIATCILYSISFVSLLLLFGYFLTRYCTNKRGGVFTGFTTAALVMVSVGLCADCALKIVKIILNASFVHGEVYKRSKLLISIVQYYFYFLSLCWLSIVCFTNTKRRFQLIPPKTNRLPKDYGFKYSQFQRWLLCAIILPGLICAIGIIIYKQKKRLVQNDQLDEILIYPLLYFNIVAGFLVSFNILCIIIIAWMLEKSSRSVRRFPPRSTWNSLTRGLKEAIKICFILFGMWLIQMIDFCLDNKIKDANSITNSIYAVLKLICALQGFILFVANFFYRSTRDPNPVLLQLKKIGANNLKISNKDIEMDGINKSQSQN